VEAGRVFLPQGAAWLPEFLDEVSSFPNCAHDDQTDALTQALNFLRGEGAEPGIIGHYRLGAERLQQRAQLLNGNGQPPTPAQIAAQEEAGDDDDDDEDLIDVYWRARREFEGKGDKVPLSPSLTPWPRGRVPW